MRQIEEVYAIKIDLNLKLYCGYKYTKYTGGVARVRIPLGTYTFILNFSLSPLSEQLSGAHANEIKHRHSPVVIVVLDPRYG